MPADSQLIRSLELVLEEECGLQAKYAGLLEEERSSITKLASEKVHDLADRRRELCDAMLAARDRRLEIVEDLAGASNLKLSDVVPKLCDANGGDSQTVKLTALTHQLKDLIKKTKSLSREFNQIVNFSLNLVNGTLSTIRSAANGDSAKSYNPKGMIKDGIGSTKSTAGDVGKKA